MGWDLAIWPDRAQYRPGANIGLVAQVSGVAGHQTLLRVTITCRARELEVLSAQVDLDGVGDGHAILRWTPPTVDKWTAFGVNAVLMVEGAAVAEAHSAFDIAQHWGQAPRYGFLSDFRSGSNSEEDASKVDSMLRLHLNCVQFYDWMYTHYDYIPPEELFTDVLGRTVDFGVVRRRIQMCRERGMAPIGYGSVYGAEKPFSDAHPDWLLYDGAGRPMHLAGFFYIQDPSPGSGWREYLLGAYRQALALGFAGIHCDTYGSPKSGLTQDGRIVHLDQVLPGLLADAQGLAETADPVEGGSMLNNVKGWPLEAMAEAPGAALYVEVWPPDETYRDLYEMILKIRNLDRRRQPILAAYLSAFFPKHERPVGAMAGLRLASATVFASGGFHLLPGEGQGILAHAYYPDHGRLNEQDWEVVRTYWDFQTRYGPLLADPDALDVTSANTGPDAVEARFSGPEGTRFSAKAVPETVWTILKEGAGYRTVQLINLTAVERPLWNSAQPEPPVLSGITVRLVCLRRPAAVWWASPDVEGGGAQAAEWSLEFDDHIGQVLAVTLPTLHYWAMLVVEEGE